MAFYGITDGDLLEMINGMNSDLVSKETYEPNNAPATAQSSKPKAMTTAQSPKPAPATASQTPDQAEIKKLVTANWGIVLNSFGYSKGADSKTNDEALSGARAWLKRNVGIESAGDIKSTKMLNQFQLAVDKLIVELEAMNPKGPEAFEGDLL